MSAADWARRLEIGALLALCFFLPLYEAPKNIFCLLYVLAWLVSRVCARDFGGRWNLWDSLIAAWLASGIVVAVFAGIPGGDEWRALADPLRYVGVLWLVSRARYDAREARWILGTLVASTLIGLALAYVAIARGQEGGLQLNSVGHVNHTAIYLAIVLGVCISWLLARWRSAPPLERAFALAATGVIAGSLLFTASRGAIGMAFVLPIVLAAAWRRRWRAALPVTSLVVAAIVVAGFAARAEVFLKQEAYIEARNILSNRGLIWHAALDGWRRYPWAGVGVDNFKLITEERLRAWRKEAGEDFDPDAYAFFRHGHSLFFNTLAERGVIGIVPLIALLAAWLVTLVRRRPGADDDDDAWLVWGSAAGAWIITVGVGAVNTTLHHEHGILAAALFGLWLSRLPKR